MLILDFRNGSEEQFKSWERDENLGAATIHDVVVDEAHLITRSANGIIRSRRGATLGPIRYSGNASHTGGEWWRICKGSEQSDGRVSFRKWTWRHRLEALRSSGLTEEAGEYQRFIDEEREHNPGEEFERLYEAEFLRLGTGLIDLRSVMTLGGDEANPVRLPYRAEWDGEPCVGGLDLGQRQDHTVLMIFGRLSGRLLCMARFLGESWAVQVARVMRLATGYCRLPSSGADGADLDRVSITIFFDETGIGGPVRELLRAASVDTAVTFRGVTFNSENKIEMIQAMQVSAEQRSMSLPFVRELAIECDTLERTPTATGVRYKASSGFKDDCVWSCGLALYGRKRIISGTAVFG